MLKPFVNNADNLNGSVKGSNDDSNGKSGIKSLAYSYIK